MNLQKIKSLAEKAHNLKCDCDGESHYTGQHICEWFSSLRQFEMGVKASDVLKMIAKIEAAEELAGMINFYLNSQHIFKHQLHEAVQAYRRAGDSDE